MSFSFVTLSFMYKSELDVVVKRFECSKPNRT